MAKLKNDKYYTPSDLAGYVVLKTENILGEDNITEYLEPSAGSGIFLDYINIPFLAYDIEPEDKRIEKNDYLKLNLDYKRGRCVIGNPPYGEKNLMSVSFYKKSVQLADYISFILPISQWNNNQQMYDFDLIYSENLGKRLFSDREVHCCFNIYSRPDGGLNTSPQKYKLNDVTLRECRKSRNQYVPKDFKYDIGMCSWGYIGREIEYEGQYNQELYVKINNLNFKDRILELIKNADWSALYPMTTTPRLKQWQVLKYLKENIPELC